MVIMAYISWLKTKKALKLMHVLWARDIVHPGSWTIGASVFSSRIILSAQFCWADLFKMLSVGTDYLLSICARSLKCVKYTECIAVCYRLGAPGLLYVYLLKCVSRAATCQTQRTYTRLTKLGINIADLVNLILYIHIYLPHSWHRRSTVLCWSEGFIYQYLALLLAVWLVLFVCNLP